ILLCRANMLPALFSRLRRGLFLLPNTLSSEACCPPQIKIPTTPKTLKKNRFSFFNLSSRTLHSREYTGNPQKRLFPAKIRSQYRDGLIWLKVDVIGKSEPLNFLLDSGAGISAIDLQTARNHGVY